MKQFKLGNTDLVIGLHHSGGHGLGLGVAVRMATAPGHPGLQLGEAPRPLASRAGGVEAQLGGEQAESGAGIILLLASEADLGLGQGGGQGSHTGEGQELSHYGDNV